MTLHRWDKPGLPHAGWDCEEVYDLGNQERSSCQMCGKEEIRYVHVMCHPDVPEPLEVGCVCAGRMSDGYVQAKGRERHFKNKMARKAKWLSRNWRMSAKGNLYLNIEGLNIGVHRKESRWGYRLENRFSAETFETENEAMLALFEAFWEAMYENRKFA